jgi:protein-tyrosine phosphatase
VTIAKREDQTRPRILAWDGCLNARDLGGYLTKDGHITRWGAIVRSDSLAALTPAGQQSVQSYGIRTIIDLRLPIEVAEAPNPFAAPSDHDISYFHQSFLTTALEPDAQLPSLADDYVLGLKRHADSVAKVMNLIANASDGGVLIHCAGGRDRTGLISALVLAAVDVPLDTIAEDYALSTECLRPRDLDYLENGPGARADRERMLVWGATRPAVMRETLVKLAESCGSVRGYLVRIGCTHEDLSRIQTRLIEQSSLPSNG